MFAPTVLVIRTFSVNFRYIFCPYILRAFRTDRLLQLFFIQVLRILTKKFTVTRHFIFWCARELTSKILSKSLLDIGILILNIIYQLEDLEQIFAG